ncbi:hypothetical protein [Chlorogloeopsis fritschii]|uniref:hypothetical protein n=1 Tax=Chlorogloeopsis fritschii TaxID=1124 RepID=UPI0023EF7FF0|nr:hypothetical protein [Chlorogloeopsis fritschii]
MVKCNFVSASDRTTATPTQECTCLLKQLLPVIFSYSLFYPLLSDREEDPVL